MQKKKSGVKNVWKFVPLRGVGGGGQTPNGKCHLKFPFLLFEPFPNARLANISLSLYPIIFMNRQILSLVLESLQFEGNNFASGENMLSAGLRQT